MHRSLVGGHVQRVTVGYTGMTDLAVLQLRFPGETVHLVVDGRVGLGIVDAETARGIRRALAGCRSPAQPRWRDRVEGARIVAVGDRSLAFEGAGGRGRIEADGALHLDGADGPGEAERSPPNAEFDAAVEGAALRDRGAAIARGLGADQAGDRRQALLRALAKAEKVLHRRAQAVRADLAKMGAAQEDATRARLFVAEAARAKAGTTALRAVDWSTGDARTIEMQIDPARPPQAQLETLFRRARRLKEGARIGRARLEDTDRIRAQLASLKEALAEPAPDFDAIEARARAVAPRDFKLATAVAPGRERSSPRARLPFRTFRGRTGALYWVGRGATDNDELTFKVARPHHLWLHAKGHAGAHVVVPLDKGAACPAEALVDAAHLAAHFSDARGSRVVDVEYTPRRYVRKPRGSAAGAVVVDREKVFPLRVDDEILRVLLTNETSD